MSKSRIWRVDAIHVNGYHAPSQYVVTEDGRLWKAMEVALTTAKQNSRLSAFSEWVFVATRLKKKQIGHKWVDCKAEDLV